MLVGRRFLFDVARLARHSLTDANLSNHSPSCHADINIAPLLASVGGIGVIVGLITQSLMGNIAAAVTLVSGPSQLLWL